MLLMFVHSASPDVIFQPVGGPAHSTESDEIKISERVNLVYNFK